MLYESAAVRLACDDGVATLQFTFDQSRFNLNSLLEIGQAFEIADRNPAVELLVLRSGSLAGFCTGFDLDTIANLSDAEAHEFATAGQNVCQRLAGSSIMTIAFLEGPVLGPGLDLALACDYRLAVATPAAWYGYSELQHGVLSPWGGLTRLTRIIGASRAMEFLTANGLRTAREALRLGIVDRATPGTQAKVELRTMIDELRARPRKPRRWHTPFDSWAAQRVTAAYRDWADHAPSAASKVVRIIPQAAASEEVSLATERVVFAEVMVNDAARATFEFHRSERKMIDWTLLPSAIAVVGPVAPVADLVTEGLLGGGTVSVAPLDEFQDAGGVTTQLQLALARGRLTAAELKHTRSRFRILTEGDDSKFDLVLLTTDAAQPLELAELLAKPPAPIVAVNQNFSATTMLCCRPRNLAGINRFEESVCEIVRTPEVSLQTIARLEAWLITSGLTTLTVSRSLVKPLRVAWWDEAVRLVADGLPIHLVDDAARSLGARMGPLEVLDGVGLEAVAAEVPRVKPLLEAGIRGRPSKEGFYVLAADNPTCSNAVAQLVLLEAAAGSHSLPRLQAEVDEHEAVALCRERLTARLIVAAATLLSHEKYAAPADIDLAVVRGLGLFAACGGLLQRCDRLGHRTIIKDLQSLRQRFGERFRPPPELTRRAVADELFYAPSSADLRSLKRTA